MAVSVEVPDMGEDMAGGLVAEWYRPDGASVEPGDPVCRVECSYVAVDLEAERGGMLRHRRPAGSIERPGVVLGVILAPGESMPPEEKLTRHSESESELAPPPDVEPEAAVFELEPEPEPEDEFEEALAESVVVPFPRRFIPPPAAEWDSAPGDAVAFGSSLFGDSAEELTEELPVPGGSIPGLPLWEPEDGMASADGFSAQAKHRFDSIAAEVAATAQVLSMSVAIDTAEATRMRAVCEREWRRFDATPLLEDIVFRALALAQRDASFETKVGGILIAGSISDVSCGVIDPAGKALREAVAARESGGDAPLVSADWLLVSLASHGVASATPRLDSGRVVSFAMGAPDRVGLLTITMSYESIEWNESSAARLLARVRALIEAPYAMLV